MQDKIGEFVIWFFTLLLKPTVFQIAYLGVLGLVALYLLIKWKLHPAIDYYIDNPKFRNKHTLYCFIVILPAPIMYIFFMFFWAFFTKVLLAPPNAYDMGGREEEIKAWKLYCVKLRKQLIIHSFVYNTTFILFGSLATTLGILVNSELLVGGAMITTFVFSNLFLEISCEIYRIRKKKLINK